MDVVTNDHDTQFDQIIAAVSELIDRATNHPDGFIASESAVRDFAGSGGFYLWIGEAVEITAVETRNGSTYTEWDAADWNGFSGDPFNPNWNGAPYHGVIASGGAYSAFPSGAYNKHVPPTKNVRITARWGYSVTPPGVVREATIIQTGRLYKRAKGAFGDAIANADLGQILYRAKLDPDMISLIERGRLIRPPM